MGVEVTLHRTAFEHLFEQDQGTPLHGQPVKTWSGADPAPWDTFRVMSESNVDNAPEHPSIARFRDALTGLGGEGRIVVLPDSVHTAALAAEALGCEVGAIANSLLFAAAREDGTDEPILVLTSGAHRVDVDKAAGQIGVTALRRAKPDFVKESTGQVIGGVSPIAHPAPIRTFLDPTLRQYPVIWAAAGHPAAVFSTSYDELAALTGATEIEVN